MLAEPTTDDLGAAEAPPKGGSKLRLMRLADLDGRTKARRAADKLLADLLSDLGGEEHVSTAKRAIAEHAAVMNAMAVHQGTLFLAGQPIDVTEYATLTNALRRLLADLGFDRVPKDVTPPLRDYIASKAQAAA